MAQVPPLSDPSHRRSSAIQGPNSESGRITSLGDLTNFLGRHGAGASSSDLALDLLLNEMVTQACLTTGATGAAIAMDRKGTFVCRATTGINAPELGAHLDGGTGLSGICIQTGHPQRCDDASTDPRVDAAACWRLGVQSILMVPVLRGREVLGVFEIFSPLPNAFGERQEQTLSVLSRRIADTLAEAAIPAPASSSSDEKDVAVLLDASRQEPREPIGGLFAGSQPRRRSTIRDYWTPILTVLIIGVSVLLGWMVGRAGWLRASRSVNAPLTATAQKPDVAAQPIQLSPPPLEPSKTVSDESPASPAKLKATPGGLTVYEAGKLVFQMKPAPGSGRNGVEMAASRSKAGEEQEAVQVPPAEAESYLINRVEPHYPDQARQEHVQGAVQLQAWIGKDGSVQKLSALSGDPQLAIAAADAVRQWRFKPYAPQGTTVAFQTQITVNFTLP